MKQIIKEVGALDSDNLCIVLEKDYVLFQKKNKVVIQLLKEEDISIYANLEGFDTNNPYKYIDSSGNLIELVLRDVQVIGGGKYLHAYFDISPEHPNAFNGAENFQLGSEPNSLILIGAELKSRDKDEKGVSEEYARIALDTPNGDTQGINDLLEAAKKIDQAHIEYTLFPDLESGENSNSFASTVISQAGLNLPEGMDYEEIIPEDKKAPGLGRVFNIDNYRMAEKYYYNPLGNRFMTFQRDKENNRPNRPSGGAWGWNPETGWWRVRGT